MPLNSGSQCSNDNLSLALALTPTLTPTPCEELGEGELNVPEVLRDLELLFHWARGLGGHTAELGATVLGAHEMSQFVEHYYEYLDLKSCPEHLSARSHMVAGAAEGKAGKRGQPTWDSLQFMQCFSRKTISTTLPSVALPELEVRGPEGPELWTPYLWGGGYVMSFSGPEGPELWTPYLWIP